MRDNVCNALFSADGCGLLINKQSNLSVCYQTPVPCTNVSTKIKSSGNLLHSASGKISDGNHVHFRERIGDSIIFIKVEQSFN